MTVSLESSLNALPHQDLIALVMQRAGHDDDFRLWLETEITISHARQTGNVLDSEPFRQRAEALLAAGGAPRHDYDHWRHYGSDIDEDELAALIEQAKPFLAAGDALNALAILVPVTGALARNWPDCAEWDETLYEFFPPLDRMLAQALLLESAQTMREELVSQLSDWQDLIEECGVGIDEAFATAIQAGTDGWNKPALQDILEGRGTDDPAWREAEPMTDIRLAALEAMGQTEGFLRLAEATGRVGDVCVMLAKCGRGADAIALAHDRLRDSDGAYRLILALWDRGERDAAFAMAEWALAHVRDDSTRNNYDRYDRYAIPHTRYLIATWLRETAARRPDLAPDLAITAAIIMFEERHTGDDYRNVRTLCPPSEWPALRDRLLQHLLAADYAPERIDLLLDEGMIEKAIAVVRRDGRGHDNPFSPELKRLVREAGQANVDTVWASRFAMGMARPIIEAGRSRHYDLAVEWLALARDACLAGGMEEKWQGTLDTLIRAHGRKRSLRPGLERLRDGG